MVIDNRNFACVTITPLENDTPLLVDSDTPEPLPVTFQLFQSIGGWNSKILKVPSLIDHPELPTSPNLNVIRKFSRTPTGIDFFGF